MSARRVLVVGAGRRVREAALPALQRASDAFRVQRIYARSARVLECGGVEYEVAPLQQLTASDLAGADLVYLAVGKDAVPRALQALCRFDTSRVELLIDTPVLRFKHFRHVRLARAFRATWVAEDCTRLPWFDAVRQPAAREHLGALRSVTFFHSAYAYHGIATAKALLESPRVISGKRRRLSSAAAERRLTLAGGRSARILEPRDYATGRVLLEGARGSIADFADEGGGHSLLRPRVEAGVCTGFEVGDARTELSAAERELMAGVAPGASVTALMEPMKRVGFLRLLRDIACGKGAYPMDDALDDMVVDYHLEKLGRYVANPFTSYRSPLARALIATLSRASRS